MQKVAERGISRGDIIQAEIIQVRDSSNLRDRWQPSVAWEIQMMTLWGNSVKVSWGKHSEAVTYLQVPTTCPLCKLRATGAPKANFHVLTGPLDVPTAFLPSRIVGLIFPYINEKHSIIWLSGLTYRYQHGPALLEIQKVQSVTFLFLSLLLNLQMANLPLLQKIGELVYLPWFGQVLEKQQTDDLGKQVIQRVT